MGEFKGRVKGRAHECIGDSRAAIGGATDNERRVEEDRAQHARGHLHERKGEIEGAMGDDV
jgi:uncharacterized protein YjbJ (UPF0337 family)